MRNGRRWLGAVLAVLGAAQTAFADEVSVAVASNFAKPLAYLAQTFEEETGHSVAIASGSSGKIFAQIEQGAPFDIFLSADQLRPQRLAEERNTKVAAYAQGRLAMVSRRDAPPISQARIGIAEPALAPYGVAAERALASLGYDLSELDIITGQSVANVASFLQSGNIDVGFLAYSQAFPSPEYITKVIDDPTLTQSMVLLSETDAALAFFEYLQSEKVRRELPSLGYLAPSSETSALMPLPELQTSLWPSIRLSLQLASLTTLILLIFGIPLAWWLTVTRSRFRAVVETITALPLVVPPTVLGFYLLVMFAPDTPIGKFWVQVTGETLTFSFAGLLIASILYSLPFAIQPLHTGFQAVGRSTIEVAQTMGASRISMFKNVILPLSRRGVLTAAVLSFAHTIGEFGVVLMVGGNLPGKTRVISIEIFNRVEVLDYRSAHLLAGGLLIFSFIALLMIYSINGRTRGVAGGLYD
ncbi:molybdate ABC transporter permease subunit [Falsihalocynthiibacter sp. SS001]|uniref:molybdate ABC transporter permease subunit n=1 Tax=Falsihalocynthiibacter sp. SS001 TaxID=3349698 RepID=UPI0036D3D1C1